MNDTGSNGELKSYRSHLISAEQKAQEDFDKAVLSLSGGALGVSFAFVKDIIGHGPIVKPNLLVVSWLLWGASIVSILASYFFSHLSLRHAIRQVDRKRIYDERPGGWFDIITAVLNAAGGLLFIFGVIAIAYFVSLNISKGGQ
jgi:hypothetical protein